MSTTEIPPLPELQQKFETLEKDLNSVLVERRPMVNAAVTALVSRSSVFLLGPPGEAKSMLVNELVKRIDAASKFEILMDRFTKPDEVFGPLSLKALKDDRYERRIDDYLATANLAFLDEIFKANSSVLNALLMALNERKYRHGTDVIDIPLAVVYCASNELPEDQSLNALYDRLSFRFVVDPVRDTSNFVKVLNLDVPADPTPVLSWTEVEQAQQEATGVEIPDMVMAEVANVRTALAEENIHPTTRRWRQSMGIIRAAAWLDGEEQADVDHIRPLQDVLWDTPEQVDTIQTIVRKVANPLEAEANELLSHVQGLEAKIDEVVKNDEAKNSRGVELHGKLKRAAKDLKGLREKAGNSRRRNVTLDEVGDKLVSLTQRVLTDVFDFNPDEAANFDPEAD